MLRIKILWETHSRALLYSAFFSPTVRATFIPGCYHNKVNPVLSLHLGIDYKCSFLYRTHRSRSSRAAAAAAAKKRKRVATVAQRRAANIRERRRMFNLNEAFDKLRRKVPTFAYEKRLSRIETLRLAITYIGFMDQVIRSEAKSSSSSNKSCVMHPAPDASGGDNYQQQQQRDSSAW